MITNANDLVNADYLGGLTKREYFAALAMQSFLISYNGSDSEHIAAWAVQAADRLIYKLNEYNESTITK